MKRAARPKAPVRVEPGVVRRLRPGRPFLYFLAVSAAFLALALPHLESPRIGWEEAIVPSAAIELLAGQAISPHFVPLRVAGRDWPLLFNVRGTGAVESYLMLPVFKLFGASVFTLRLAETLLTLFAGLLLVRAAGVLFDEETAYTAAPLLLLNASFLLYGTRDGFEGGILVQWLFLALSLLAFARVLQGRGEYLPWAALALGAGVYAKLHFLGIALGMSAVYACLVAMGRCRAPRPGVALAAAACFAVGCLPFVLWNLSSGGASFRQLGALSRNPYSAAGSLGLRLLQLGGYLRGQVWPVASGEPGWLGLAGRAAPSAALLYCLTPSFGARFPKARTRILCLTAISAIFLIVISRMLTLPGHNHVLPALPLILLAYSASFRYLVPGRAARAALVALLLLTDLSALRAFHVAAGAARAPDSFEELAAYLAAHRIDRPINVNDHDLGPELEVLTAGQVIPTQVVFLPAEAAERFLTGALRQPASAFLMTEGRGLTQPERSELFERLLAREGLSRRVLRTFEGGKILLFEAKKRG